jgi:catechol 2,3-dioxygenase-like lactoylglutathione lyase family enzyme
MPTKTKAKTGSKNVTVVKTTAKTAAKNGKAAAPAKLSLTKLGYAITFVSDMKRAVKFYKDVLGIPVRFESEGWSELEMKGFTLALHPADKMPKNLDQAPITELCFEAGDVRGVRAALIAQGVKVTELHNVCEMGPNIGAAGSFRDPDGNHLSIFGMVPKSEWTGPSECC